MVFLNADNKVVLVSNHKSIYHDFTLCLIFISFCTPILSSTLLNLGTGPGQFSTAVGEKYISRGEGKLPRLYLDVTIVMKSR